MRRDTHGWRDLRCVVIPIWPLAAPCQPCPSSPALRCRCWPPSALTHRARKTLDVTNTLRTSPCGSQCGGTDLTLVRGTRVHAVRRRVSDEDVEEFLKFSFESQGGSKYEGYAPTAQQRPSRT